MLTQLCHGMECPVLVPEVFHQFVFPVHSCRHMFWIHGTCTIPTSVFASFAELPLTRILTLVLFLDRVPLSCMCWALASDDNV